ncbi:EamA family transporter [Winogradskyella sp.]|uniref:EamA family transporter n=2 Tax=Winogradskyella sp. TaxID=1883156 RepID=UPI0035149C1C
MIYLILSILSSTAIFVVFKLLSKYNVNTLQVIVINYIVAFTIGISLNDERIRPEIIYVDWFMAAIGLGILFITIFNVMALTAQKNGLSVASVASKMSVIIPVLFGIIVYGESAGLQKIIGIILALTAVFLASIKPKSNVVLTKSIYLPILLFLGSGIIDTSINHFAPNGNKALFLAVIFGISGIIGLLILSYKSLILKHYFKTKSIPFGIVLGIINYASIHYILKALRVDGFESSSVFTINNVAIVAVSTLVGLFLFKERISGKNWFGILLALISIALVTL